MKRVSKLSKTGNVLVKALQENRTNMIWKETQSEGLACMIMEDAKPCNLLFASWRPGKASGVSSLSVKAWKPGSWWWKSQSEGRGRWHELPQLNSEARERWIPPSLACCSVQAGNGLDDAHPHYRGQITDSTADLVQKPLHRHPERTLNLGTPWSFELAYKNNHHRKYLFNGSQAVEGRKGGVWV